jgi:hypothetical protein
MSAKRRKEAEGNLRREFEKNHEQRTKGRKRRTIIEKIKIKLREIIEQRRTKFKMIPKK